MALYNYNDEEEKRRKRQQAYLDQWQSQQDQMQQSQNDSLAEVKRLRERVTSGLQNGTYDGPTTAPTTAPTTPAIGAGNGNAMTYDHALADVQKMRKKLQSDSTYDATVAQNVEPVVYNTWRYPLSEEAKRNFDLRNGLGLQDQTTPEKRDTINTYIDGLSDEAKKLLQDYTEGYLQSSSGGNNAKPQTGALFTWDTGGVGSMRRAQREGGLKMQDAREALKQELGLDDKALSNLLAYQEYIANYGENERRKEELADTMQSGNALQKVGKAINLSRNAILTSPIAGITAAASQIANPHPELGTDTYNPAYGMLNNATNTQQAVQNAINPEGEEGSFGRKALSNIYGWTYSAAESAYGMAAAGAVGLSPVKGASKAANLAKNVASLLPMGVSAYAGTLQAAQERGITGDAAQMTAAVAGAAEVVTEIASLDKVWDAVKANRRTARKMLVDWGVGSLIEGTEEVASDVINRIADGIINGDTPEGRSEYAQNVQNYMAQGMSEEDAKKQASKDWWANLGLSFLGGFVSGAESMGLATGANYIRSNAIANEMYGNANYRQLATEAEQNAPSTWENDSAKESWQSYMARLNELANRQENGEKITQRDRRNLYWDLEDAANTEYETREESGTNERMRQEAAQREEEAGRAAEEEANNPTPIASPSSLDQEESSQVSSTPYQQEALGRDEITKRLAEAQSPTELATVYQQVQDSGNTEDIDYLKQVFPTYTSRMVSEIEDEGERIQSLDVINRMAMNGTLTQQRAYQAGLEGREINPDEMSDEIKLAYNEGQIANREAAAAEARTFRDTVEEMSNPAMQDSFIAHYQGSPIEQYKRVFTDIFEAGRLSAGTDADQEIDLEELVQRNGAAAQLLAGEEVSAQDAIKQIYQDGANAALEENKQIVMRELGAKLTSKGMGSFTDSRTTRRTNEDYRGLEGVARFTGLDIELRNQEQMPQGTNGFYDPKTGKLVLSDGSGNVNAFGLHELGEFAFANNPEEFISFADAVLSTVKSKLSPEVYQELRESYVGGYQWEDTADGRQKLAYHKFTDADVDKEMANDLIFAVMGDEDLAQAFADNLGRQVAEGKTTAKEARTILEKISDFISEVVDAIKNIFKKSTPQTTGSGAFALPKGTTQNFSNWQMFGREVEELEQFRDRFKDIVAKAVENYAAKEVQAGPDTPASRMSRVVSEERADVKTIVSKLGRGASIEVSEDGDFQLATNKDASTVVVNLASMDLSENRYSRKTLEATQTKLRKILEDRSDLKDEDVDRMVDQINQMANILADVSLTYEEMAESLNTDIITDITGKRQVLRALVKNGEYPVNVDFLTICKKRQAYMRVLTDLIDDGTFSSVSFNPDAIAEVNDILRKNKYETACLGCFVESRRLQIQKWSETFVDAWNRQVEIARKGKDVLPFDFGKNARGETSLTDEEIAALEKEFSEGGKKNNKGNLNLGTGTVEEKMARLLEKMPHLAKTLDVGDILKPNGVANLRAHNGNLYSLLLQWYGSNTPKVNQDFNPYNGEFADLTYSFMSQQIREGLPQSKRYKAWAKGRILAEHKGEQGYKPKAREVEARAIQKYLFDIGGARLQSFSDFLIENTLDYFQMVGDLAAKQYPMHAYSKEIPFFRIFGMTGIKSNMSLIPVVNREAGEDMAGLNPDGSYAGWGDYERHVMLKGASFIQSIGWKDAIALQLDPRYSSNIGTIAIGISDAHIRKMLDDPLIRMIIPYHASGMNPEYAKAMNIDYYTDYTDYQNTTVKQYYDLNGKPVESFHGKPKVDMSYDYNEALQRLGDARAAAQEYIEWCAQEHPVYVGKNKVGTAVFSPKFEAFTDHQNYYKLLEDFNVYDAITEQAAPQRAVQMIYPDADHQLTPRQLKEYEQRLRDTGEFTEKDIQKYVKRAGEDLETIIRNEAKERNDYHRKADERFDGTYDEIKTALKKYKRSEDDGIRFSKTIDLEKEIASYEITKPNDYIHVQKQIKNKLREEGYFETNADILNEVTGMHIAITPKGINETFNFDNYKKVPADKKKLKIALVRSLPEIIREALPDGLDHDNYHDINKVRYAYFKDDISVNDKELTVRVLVRKGDTKNSFWVHHIDINENGSDELKTRRTNPTSRSESSEPSPMVSQSEQSGNEVSRRDSRQVDSEGNRLTENQAEYFKDSKVRDQNGNLLLVHHGTNADFTVFDRNKIGAHGSFEGAGFNFTPSKTRAGGYRNIGENEGRVLSGYLNITNPLSTDRKTITVAKLASLIREMDPTGDDIISNYARETRDYGTPAFIRREALVTARTIHSYADTDTDIYSELSSGGVDSNAIIEAFQNAGYDGAIHYNDDGTIKTLIAFDSNQFKLADNQNPTTNPDMRFSRQVDSDGHNLTQEQAQYFEDSKVRDDQGNLLRVYHGTLTGGFTIFDAAKSDDKRTLFFSSDPGVSSTYASRDEEGGSVYPLYLNVTNPLVLDANGSGAFSILRKSETPTFEITWEDPEGYGEPWIIHVTNADGKTSTIETTFDDSGAGELQDLIGYTNYEDFAEYFSYQEFPENWEGQERYRMREINAANTPHRFLAQYDDRTTRGWAKWAQAHGYDGVIFKNIIDVASHRDQYVAESTVVAAFDSNQVKSVFNKKPTGNPDIRYSRYIPDPATEELDIDTLDNFLDRATDGTYAVFKKDDGSYKVYGGRSLPSIQVSSIKEAQDWINQNITPLDLISLKNNWADKPVSKEALRGLVRLEASDLALNMLVGGRTILEGLNFEPVYFENIEEAKKYLIDHAEEIRSKYHRRTKLASRMRVLGEDDYTEEYKASLKNRDTEDRLLSKGQQKYFKDSKIRNDNGSLMVMYHGSSQTGFTVFDPEYSDDKISLFFTDNPGVAASYSGASSSKMFIPDKEMDFEDLWTLAFSSGLELRSRDNETYDYSPSNVNAWLKQFGQYEIRYEEPSTNREAELTAEELEFEEAKYYYAYKDGKRMDDVGAYQSPIELVNELQDRLGATFEETDYRMQDENAPAYMLVDKDENEIGRYDNLYEVQEELFNRNPKGTKGRKGSYKVYINAVNPLIVDVKGRNWNNIEFEGKRYKTRELSQLAKDRGYDGVFFKNIQDIGKFGVKGGYSNESNIAIVFNGNQVKSVDNKIPTDNPDIRYSRRIAEEVSDDELLEAINRAGAHGEYFAYLPSQQQYLLEYYDEDENEQRKWFKTRKEAYDFVGREITPFTFDQLDGFSGKVTADMLNEIMVSETYGHGWVEETFNNRIAVFMNEKRHEFRSVDDAAKYLADNKDAIRAEAIPTDVNGVPIIDTEGQTLSPGQQEFFRDSKVRDAQGALITMYKGAGNAGYTVFSRDRSEYGLGWFFTSSKGVAYGYAPNSEEFIPEEMDEEPRGIDVSGWELSGAEDMDDYDPEYCYVPTYRVLTDDRVYEFETHKAAKNFIDDAAAGYRPGIYKVYLNIKNPLVVDAKFNDWRAIPFEGNNMSTDQIAEVAKERGYDGMIIKNVEDTTASAYERYSTVAQAFDQNQIKSVANLNPTDDPDIRKSVDLSGLDDFEDGSIESIYRDQELASILRQGSEALKGQKVDSKLVNKIAGEILKKYKSAYDRKTLADNLEKLFAYAQEKNRIDYEDLSKVIREVARPVVDGVTEKVGTKEYKAFMDILRSRKIALTDRQKAEVASHSGSYGAFVKSMRGISFSSNGTPLDSMWSELVDASGGFLDPDAAEGDMPILLQQAMHDLTPYAANTFQGDADDVAANLAMEIIERYYEEAGKAQSDATLKQKLKEASDKMKKEAEEFRQTVRREYEERLKEARKEQKERSDRKRREGKYTQKDMDEAIAKMRARNKRQYEKQKEAEQQRYQKQQVMNAANKLLNMLINPTPKAHVPEALQEPVLDLLTSINFLTPTITRTKDGKYQTKILVTEKDETGKTKRRWETFIADNVADVIGAFQESLENTANGSKDQRKWNDKLRGVKDLYSQAVTPNSELSFTLRDFLEGLDQSLAADLDAIIANRNGAVAISMLNAEELKTINKVIRNIMASINKIDKLYSDPESINGVHGLAEQTMAHANSLLKNRKVKDRRRATRGAKTFLTLDNATPETFMHAIGESGERIYRMLTKAQNTKAFDLRHAQEYMIGDGSTDKEGRYNSGILKGVSQKELSEWSGDKAKIIYDGGNMKLTVADLMYLYELQKRKDAESHKYGGFEAADKIIKGKVHQDTTPHYMSSETISEITDLLTERQKEIADDIQKFLAVECSAWGNDVSMLLYGYEKFTDPNYIPMSVDKRTTRISNEQVGEGLINTIKNQGFTKALIPNASNPLIIMDIFDVFTNHVTGMAAYHAYAAPITDIIRWDNFKAIDEIEGFDGEKYGRYNTVKESLQTIFGDDGQRYLVRLVQDLNNQETRTEVGASRIQSLMGNYKSAATLANLRVVMQQPTAWLRAGEVIDYKWLAEGLKPNSAAADLQERTSAISWVKSQGNIDGYITQSMKATITGAQTWRDRINGAAGYLAGKADDVTWAALYRAVYAEQKAAHGGKTNTIDFELAVNRRFDELIARTQVVDGTLMRSQMMRSKDGMNTVFSAFMAEPTKSYNMFLRDYFDIVQGRDKTGKVRKDDLKHLSRTLVAYLLTNIINAVAQSLADAARDEKEDKDYWQKFLAAYPENLLDDLNMLNNIPIVKDFYAVIEKGMRKILYNESSYSSGSGDMLTDGMDALFTAIGNMKNQSDKTKKTPYGLSTDLISAVSKLSGVPAYNLMRDVVAIYNTVNDFWGGKNIRRTKATTAELTGNAMDTIEKSIRTGSDYKAAIEESVKRGATYDQIEKKITETYKPEYLELLEQGKKSEAATLENRLTIIYQYLDKQEGQKTSKKDRVRKWAE